MRARTHLLLPRMAVAVLPPPRRPMSGADRHAVVIKHGTAPRSSTMRKARLPGANP